MDNTMTQEEEDVFACYAPVEEAENTIPFVGLKNLGNSCYFNSVIQVLLHCPGFQQSIRLYAKKAEDFAEKTPDLKERDKKKCKVFCEFLNLCKIITKSQMSLVEKSCGNGESGPANATVPLSLLDSVQAAYPSFEPGTQQDAQECLQCLLDILHECVLMFTDRNVSDNLSTPKPDGLKMLDGGAQEEISQIARRNACKIVLENIPASKTTAVRKRGIKAKFKNPLKRFKKNDKENTEPRTIRIPRGLFQGKKNQNKDATILGERLNTSPLSDQSQRKRKASVLSSSDEKEFPGCKESVPDPKRSPLPDVMKSQDTSDREVTENIPLESHNQQSCTDDVEVLPEKSFLESMFQGEIVNKTRCVECENCDRQVENFMNVSLPVCQDKSSSDDTDVKTTLEKSADDIKQESRCCVNWGMTTFTSIEMLNGENKYYCGACKRYCEGERRVLLNKLPPILTLRLKRFTSCVGGGDNFGMSVSKINTSFDVTKEMSLKEWCSDSYSGDPNYELFAIIVHSSTTVYSGHSIAYVRLHGSVLPVLKDSKDEDIMKCFKGKWIEADDDRVRIVSEKEVISPDSLEDTSRTPYLLFYCKKGMNSELGHILHTVSCGTHWFA